MQIPGEAHLIKLAKFFVAVQGKQMQYFLTVFSEETMIPIKDSGSS